MNLSDRRPARRSYFEDLRRNALRYAIDGLASELERRGFRINRPKRTSVDRQVLISCASDAAREISGYTHVDAKTDAAMGVARDLLEGYAHWLRHGSDADAALIVSESDADAAFMVSALLAELTGFVLSQESPGWGWNPGPGQYHLVLMGRKVMPLVERANDDARMCLEAQGLGNAREACFLAGRVHGLCDAILGIAEGEVSPETMAALQQNAAVLRADVTGACPMQTTGSVGPFKMNMGPGEHHHRIVNRKLKPLVAQVMKDAEVCLGAKKLGYEHEACFLAGRVHGVCDGVLGLSEGEIAPREYGVLRRNMETFRVRVADACHRPMRFSDLLKGALPRGRR